MSFRSKFFQNVSFSILKNYVQNEILTQIKDNIIHNKEFYIARMLPLIENTNTEHLF